MAWLSGYNYRLSLTLSNAHVDSAQTDFPASVVLSANTDVGGRCRSDGYDIRFTSSDGTTLLSFSRESFAVATGAATGIFWVKIPTWLSSGNTTIYLYYGKSDATDAASDSAPWDSSFVRVYHLGTPSSLSTTDSKSVANLTNSGGTAATGKIGGAVELNGSSQYLSHATTSLPTGANARTFSCWIYPHTVNDGPAYLRAPASYGENSVGKLAMLCEYQGKLYFSGNTRDWGSALSVSANSWQHIAFTYNGGTGIKLYLNGVEASGSLPSALDTGSTAADVGRQITGATNYFDGMIDEIRYSSTQRSAAWLKLEYYNANGGDVSVGAEEANDVVAVTYPNGSEKLIVGDSETITWTKGSPTQCKVEVSRDNGSTWSEIATGQTGTSYAWTVASPVATQAKIKVTATAGGSASDQSDAAFRIATTSPISAPMIGSPLVRGVRR